MIAREIMNWFFVTLRPDDSLQRAVEAMACERVGIICVCDAQGKPLGVVTDRDLVTRGCYRRLNFDQTPLTAIMSPHPLTCSREASIQEVEALMQKGGVARVLVVDDDSALVGLITLAEIWHSESPLIAGAVSRRVTERELRVAPTGGHYDSARPLPEIP